MTGITLEPHDEIRATRLVPIHEVRDPDKLARLVASMRRDGWQGRPVLCREHTGLAWTGTHRIAAAQILEREGGDILVPVVYLSETHDLDRSVSFQFPHA